MIDFNDIDTTELAFEETTEKYYLDKQLHMGILLPDEKWHENKLEEVFPADFLYHFNDQEVIDINDYDWKLTYQFSSSERNPNIGGSRYGNPEMTFRRLYVILSEHFNHSYFIDDYFANVYPYTMKDWVEAKLEDTKKAYLSLAEEASKYVRITKSGHLDMRYGLTKEILSLGEESAESDSEEISNAVKEDIKNCLITGQIPLNFNLSSTTLKIREDLGISSVSPLYATGQLIDDLRIFFRLGKKEWQTQSGILV